MLARLLLISRLVGWRIWRRHSSPLTAGTLPSSGRPSEAAEAARLARLEAEGETTPDGPSFGERKFSGILPRYAPDPLKSGAYLSWRRVTTGVAPVEQPPLYDRDTIRSSRFSLNDVSRGEAV